jgi:hypothetical protein
MRIDQTDFILSEQELAGAVQKLGLRLTDLGMRPAASDSGADPAAFSVAYGTLPAGEQQRLAGALQTLSQPLRTLKLHYSLADESVTRSVLAWDGMETDTCVAMHQTGAGRRISSRSHSELKSLSRNILAVNDGIREAQIRLNLSAAGLLSWLAIAEQMKLQQLHALLKHEKQAFIFGTKDIEARLSEAGTEDFRWPLMFFDKVMPAAWAQAITKEEMLSAFRELEKAELMEAAGADIFELTEKGKWLATEWLHEVSKMALGLSEKRADGQTGFEMLYLVRTAGFLFMINLSGAEGILASIGPDTLEVFLDDWFRAPGAVAVSSRNCPSCQATLSPGARFCPECGTRLEADANTCGKCGHTNRPGARFCESCGNSLTG